MRRLPLALLALTATVPLAAGSCTDYFKGTTLVFEFDHLPALHRIALADMYTTSNPTGEKCADDDYAAAHPDDVDDQGNLQQPYEYDAWATINGAPVRLARFSVRECSLNSGDTTIKNAVTTVSYERLPPAQYQYPKRPSAWYGIVNQTVNSVPSGGATILTPVVIDQATEIFITREAAGVADTAGPEGTLLMLGDVVHENLVYKATLAKVSGGASGLVTAIPADRVSAW